MLSEVRGAGRRGGRRALLALVVLLAACGAADDGDGADGGEITGPTVADLRFDGRYDLRSLRADGDDAAVPSPTVFDIDAEFGALEILAGCGRLLGSFSLLPDGRAGLTIAGGSNGDCSASEAAFDQRLRAAAAAITTWTEGADGRLDLSDEPGSNVLTLVPTAG